MTKYAFCHNIQYIASTERDESSNVEIYWNRWAYKNLHNDVYIAKKSFFLDEAHFHLSEYFNK